nr:mediator of RNA polymerase II transcription subunit 34 isoform X1 [Tanacetum cinerariifolium]
MDVNARERVHMRWSNSKLQESGRAGRDGLPSERLLYFRPADVPRQCNHERNFSDGISFMFKKIPGHVIKILQPRHSGIVSLKKNVVEVLSLNILLSLCKTATGCVITVLFHARSRKSMQLLVEKFKVKNKKVGFELKKDELQQLVIQLILDRKEDFSHTAYATNACVTTGPLAKHALHGKKNITLEVTSRHKSSTSVAKSSKQGRYSGMEVEFYKMRKELSTLHGGIFPHSILSTQQIGMLCYQKPETSEHLEKIIGKLKTEKYRDKILEVIGKHEHDEEQEVTETGQMDE